MKPYVYPHDVRFFEPGDVACVNCGWKDPDDAWNLSPDGFYDVEGDCMCEPCAEQALSESITCEETIKYGEHK